MNYNDLPYEIEDWNDKGDRVVEVFLDDTQVYSSMVSDEHIEAIRAEVAAMQVWLAYVAYVTGQSR